MKAIDLTYNSVIIRHSNAVAAGSSTITPSGDIDMQDFDSALFIFEFGAITASAVTSVEIHQSSDAGVGDSYTAILGTGLAVADDADDKVFTVEVQTPRERYLKGIVNRATANAVLEGITVVKFRGRKAPTTADTTHGGREFHRDKAEGTA